jgi:hypothetical protein
MPGLIDAGPIQDTDHGADSVSIKQPSEDARSQGGPGQSTPERDGPRPRTTRVQPITDTAVR